jgi:hypothetical protein
MLLPSLLLELELGAVATKASSSSLLPVRPTNVALLIHVTRSGPVLIGNVLMSSLTLGEA